MNTIPESALPTSAELITQIESFINVINGTVAVARALHATSHAASPELIRAQTSLMSAHTHAQRAHDILTKLQKASEAQAQS